MSASGNPASRKRCAIASAAAVTLPTESVELISINCLKMSWESFLVASSIWAGDAGMKSKKQKKEENKTLPRANWVSWEREDRNLFTFDNRRQSYPKAVIATGGWRTGVSAPHVGELPQCTS